MFGHEGNFRPAAGNIYCCNSASGFINSPPGPGKGAAHENQCRARVRTLRYAIVLPEDLRSGPGGGPEHPTVCGVPVVPVGGGPEHRTVRSVPVVLRGGSPVIT